MGRTVLPVGGTAFGEDVLGEPYRAPLIPHLSRDPPPLSIRHDIRPARAASDGTSARWDHPDYDPRVSDDPFPRERVAVMLRRLPAYLRLSWRLTREPLLSRARRAAVIGAAGYLASPIDLVPGVLPVVGQLDHIAVALAAIRIALDGLSPERRRFHLDAVGLADEHLAADLRTVGATTTWLLRAGARTTARAARVGRRAAAAGAGLAARGSKGAANGATGAAKGATGAARSAGAAATGAAKGATGAARSAGAATTGAAKGATGAARSAGAAARGRLLPGRGHGPGPETLSVETEGDPRQD